MGRLKKGEQKKVQMTIRIEPDVAEKLKKIEKYSSKISAFIDIGMYEYEKWLKNIESDNILSFMKDDSILSFLKNDDILSFMKDKINFKEDLDLTDEDVIYIFFGKENFRKIFLKDLKKCLSLNYKTEKFSKFHNELVLKKCQELKAFIKVLENWDLYSDCFLSYLLDSK